MPQTVISVENLSKTYRLGQIGTGLLTDDLRVWWAKLRGQPNPVAKVGKVRRNRDGETIWALRDVSFDVQQGEVLGIIGRNGAGRSTLLKILSRVTAPTSGQIKVRGRIASLLEVGTGFHPDLTGRENIFLNGAILGMSKTEVARKLDEIVAFAEIEKFLDTPVKRYSNGMYVRLAFAVAAHLEPEILLVDEVLAVGDADFQKKCLGKMGAVASEGRTVLFVSHNMAAVMNLCPMSILLRNGTLEEIGSTQDVIQTYQTSFPSENGELDLNQYRPAWARSLIKSVRILNTAGEETSTFLQGQDILVQIDFETSPQEALKKPVMGVVLSHVSRGVVGGVNTRMTGYDYNGAMCEKATMQCTLVNPPLIQGRYSLEVWLGDGPKDLDALSGCINFTVEASDIYGTSKTPFASMGVIYFQPKWTIYVR